MPDGSGGGAVAYRPAGEGYFGRRALRRRAGFWSLWALGVGAVVSGDFFGWNFGLDAGGFGGLAIATGLVAVMYLGMCCSVAEMAAALPHSGGPYSFARTALGPWGGFASGLAATVEYVLTPAVIVVGIGGYAAEAAGGALGLEAPAPAWWLLCYALFVGVNAAGAAAAFRCAVLLTALALAVLLVFWIGAVPHFSWDLALNVPPDEGGSRLLPRGWEGAARALPFAVWFYLAIEQLPLAAEESRDPERDVPRALLWGLATLIAASVLTLVLNAGVAPGAAAVGASDEPLLLALGTIFGNGAAAPALALAAIAGLAASFHAIVYAYGRNIHTLSRAGYYPQWLSVTLPGRRTPHRALIAGAAIGYGVALLIEFGDDWFGGGAPVGAVLLNMAVFGAVVSYVIQMAAFVRLRRRFPHVGRPWVSPLGEAGAIAAAAIALVTLGALFLDPGYRAGLYGCAVWFAAGLCWFALRSRTRLVRAPEEDFALRHPPRPGR